MDDIRQSSNYAKYLKANGWIVEEKLNTFYFIKKLPLLGSVLKIQRPRFIDYRFIDRLTKKYRVFQIIIEPKPSSNYQPLLLNNFKLSKYPYLPSKTIQLDLTKTKDELFDNFKKDARYAIKKNGSLSPINFEINDIVHFRKLWKKSVPHTRYIPSLVSLKQMKKIFNKNSLFITDKKESAGAVFLIAGKTCYYWYAFTNTIGRKTQTQYKIVWEGIVWAKTKGCVIFDFEGIFDPRFPNNSWLGFSHFKKSFGGYETVFPGAFIRNSFFNLLKFT